MKTIFDQLAEWQYYMHVFIIELGLIALMHYNGIHYYHSSSLAFLILFLAIIVWDIIAHYVMAKVFGWAD